MIILIALAFIWIVLPCAKAIHKKYVNQRREEQEHYEGRIAYYSRWLGIKYDENTGKYSMVNEELTEDLIGLFCYNAQNNKNLTFDDMINEYLGLFWERLFERDFEHKLFPLRHGHSVEYSVYFF